MTNYERCKHMSVEEMALALSMNDDPNEFLLLIPMYYSWLKQETKMTPTEFDDMIERYKDKFVVKEDEEFEELPDKDLYIKAHESIIDKAFVEWSSPKYKCPKCGGGMRKNLQHCICLASYPPQYRYTYKCNKCDYTEELGV